MFQGYMSKTLLAFAYCLISLCFVCVSVADESNAVASLRSFLKADDSNVNKVADQPFAKLALTKKQAKQAEEILIDAWKQQLKKEREAELKGTVLKIGDQKMKFFKREFGEKPEAGWSLYISMHGGGKTTAQRNEQQWQNQKGLYKLEEGLYVVPRAPTNDWDMWHKAEIDQFYDRLITNLIINNDVNPNRVYILGYSAGGDGVYQLGPRLADRLAAAAMMAGHPGDAAAENLRNLPFTIHMGELDRPYNRNKKAANWKKKLTKFQEKDPEGYIHEVQIHKGKGHWMDRQDAVAIPWMSKFSRQRFPKKVVWKQDNVKQNRFYWLAVDELPAKRPLIVAQRDGQKVSIEQAEVDSVSVLLNDQMLDLDQQVSVDWGGKLVQSKKAQRTIGQLVTSLLERGDPAMMFSARIDLVKPAMEEVPQSEATSSTEKVEPKAAKPE